MATNVFIEERWADNFYTRLDTQSPAEVNESWASVDNLAVIESLAAGSPFLGVRFVDAAGVLISGVSIDPGSPFNFFLGRTSDTASKMKFALSNTKLSEIQPGSTGNVYGELSFAFDGWYKMFNTRISRSWNNVRYSEVANTIAEELGFEDIQIERSKGRYTVIQPYWTNFEMLTWLSKQAVSAQGGAPGYRIGVRADGVFFFKTMNKLFEAKPIAQLILAPRDYADTDNADYRMAYNFNIEQNYAVMIGNGAGGVKSQYYNWNTREFVEDEITLSGTKQKQLSEWFYVADDHDQAVNNQYHGRDSKHAPAISASKIARAANSINSIKVATLGNMDYHIGDLINLVVSSSESFDEIVSQYYSGYYIISKVSHQVHSRKRQFITELTLHRQGMDVPEIEGLVETQGGKSLTPIR